MRLRSEPTARAVVLACALALPVGACDLISPPSKVGQGQLYASGEGKYDVYFQTVHDKQVAAATWPEDRKTARRPLFTALSIAPTTYDSPIVSAVHDRASQLGGQGAKLELKGEPRVIATAGARPDPALFKAIEDAVRGEHDFEQKLIAVEPSLEDLARQGESLAPHVRQDFIAQGSEKVREVKNELEAAIDSMRTLESDAKRDVERGQDFVDDLHDALYVGPSSAVHHHKDDQPLNVTSIPPAATSPASTSASSASSSTQSAPPPKPAKTAQKPAEKPAEKPVEKPADTPPPLPPPEKPKPPPSEDPFNP